MRTYFILLIIFLFGMNIAAQTVQIFDESSQQPLSGVAFFNDDKSKSGISDFNGYISIDNFEASEKINFQYISYLDSSILKKDIITNNNIVFLLQDTSQLEEVVLSVARFAQNKKDVPQNIVSITSKDILFSNPQTSADLLESSGKIYVQKSQLGGGSPMIRGFSTNRVLIAIDGVRFNNAIFRSGNVQNVISIDPFSIEHTEVILGPGSVVYGSDAIGGVMNFYTLKPKFSFVDGYSFSGNAFARYSTTNNEKTGHVDFNIGLKEWAFSSSFSYSDFDDLKMGSHGPTDYLRTEYVDRINNEDAVVQNNTPLTQISTGYDQINFMQKIRFNPNETWNFDLGLFYSKTSDVPRYDRLIERRNGALRSAEWYYGPQKWLSANLQITKKGRTIYDEVKFTGSFQQFKESRHNRKFGSNSLKENFEKVAAFTTGLDFHKELNTSNIFYGFEYVYNKVHSDGTLTDITTGDTQLNASRYPDGSTWQSMAAYISYQLKINPKLTLQSGLRYSHVLLEATFDDTFFDFSFDEANIDTGSLTGSIGLAWQPNKTIGWKANFSTAFRAPNIDDVGKVFDSEPGSVVVPNPDLKPEYAYTSEIGLTLNFDGVVKLDLATYFTKLDDALVRRDFSLNGETVIDFEGEPSNVQAIQNAAKAEIYGFEAGVEINFSEMFQVTSQFNLTDGFQEEDDGSEAPIRHAAPIFGNAHLIWKNEKLKFDASIDYNGKFDFDDLAPSQQSNSHLYALDSNGNPYSPSWYTLNFSSQYQVSKNWLATVSLENITDQRYRPYSSGITAAGRNLIMAIRYSF